MNIAKDSRWASVERVTSETSIRVEWRLDGTGGGQIQTTLPFVDHMLTLFAKHGFFDLTVEAKSEMPERCF